MSDIDLINEVLFPHGFRLCRNSKSVGVYGICRYFVLADFSVIVNGGMISCDGKSFDFDDDGLDELMSMLSSKFVDGREFRVYKELWGTFGRFPFVLRYGSWYFGSIDLKIGVLKCRSVKSMVNFLSRAFRHAMHNIR